MSEITYSRVFISLPLIFINIQVTNNACCFSCKTRHHTNELKRPDCFLFSIRGNDHGDVRIRMCVPYTSLQIYVRYWTCSGTVCENVLTRETRRRLYTEWIMDGQHKNDPSDGPSGVEIYSARSPNEWSANCSYLPRHRLVIRRYL